MHIIENSKNRIKLKVQLVNLKIIHLFTKQYFSQKKKHLKQILDFLNDGKLFELYAHVVGLFINT